MRAKELSFTAKTISGIQAKEYGIALESFPLNEFALTCIRLQKI